MKNVRIFSINDTHRLYDYRGHPVDIFNNYALYLSNHDRNYSKNTINSYCQTSAEFIDYLIECGCILGEIHPSPSALKNAIKNYRKFLKYGRSCKDPYLNRVATSLDRSALDPASVKQKRSAIKSFLGFCDKIAEELDELRTLENPEPLNQPFRFLKQNDRARSHFEKSALQRNSLLAGNLREYAKYEMEGRQRTVLTGSEDNYDGKHFPPNYILDLLDAANNPRDEALWALLAGGGLRQSEGLALAAELINPRDRTIQITDPNGLRGSEQDKQKDKLPWKGRNTAKVYIYEPIKCRFFSAYERYLHIQPSGNSPFVFRHLSRSNYGEDMITSLFRSQSLNSSMNEAFRKAIRKINKKYGHDVINPSLSLHSLRHSYGYYLLNYHRIPGRSRPGLELHEVQRLMGHSSIETTKKYAQRDRKLFEAELSAADQILNGMINPADMQLHIARSYRKHADELESKIIKK